MAYDQALADRVKAALRRVRDVEEKRMFGGIAFMVQGKMCVTVGRDRIMCRIDPAVHDEVLQRKGTHTVTMRGRPYHGFVHVDAGALKSKRDLDYWVGLALAFNKHAKAAVKKRKRRHPKASTL